MKKNIRRDILALGAQNIQLQSLDGGNVLNSAKFQFQEGDVVRIEGKQGCCSEFLKMLAVLNTNWAGNYFINKDSLNEMSFEEFQPYRLNIGYTFDHGGLLNNKTILENILLPLQYHNEIDEEEALALCLKYLEDFELSEFKDLRPAMTPGYVRKLGCVIRTLVQNPQVLIMDGPTTAIDKEKADLLVQIIHEKRKRGELKIVVFTSTYDQGFEIWNPSRLYIENGQLQTKLKKELVV